MGHRVVNLSWNLVTMLLVTVTDPNAVMPHSTAPLVQNSKFARESEAGFIC